MLTIALLSGLVASITVSAQGSVPCGEDTGSCPEDRPCCSRQGFCGEGAGYCVLGCQPFHAHSVDSCAANALCSDLSTDFRDGLSRIHTGDFWDYNGNVDDFDWVVTASGQRVGDFEAVEEDEEGMRINMHPFYSSSFDGTRFASSRYMLYGTVDVVMKASRWGGITSTFMLLSDVRQSTRFDFGGSNTSHLLTSYEYLDRWEDIPGTQRSDGVDSNTTEVISLGSSANTSAEFHKYTFDWQEDYVRWLIDDEEVRRLDRDDVDEDNAARFPSAPSRIEFAIKGSTTSAYDTGPRPYWDDPDIENHSTLWMTIQSIDIRCASSGDNGDDDDDITGWSYLASGSQMEPEFNMTDREVTVSGEASASALLSRLGLITTTALAMSMMCMM